MKQKALLICPGRGTYNKDELGYLSRYHSDKAAFIASVDAYRARQNQMTVSALDGAEKFSLAMHSRGDNASPLIYACAYADFKAINRDKFDIVAVTGNSMGWYIALACGGAATDMNALHIINTMGTMMQDSLIGGQLIYSLVDDNWQPVKGRRDFLLGLIREIDDLYVSIELGGMLVFGGSNEALTALEQKLPPEGRFPMRLQNHAAFHTPLQKPGSAKAFDRLGKDLFQKPSLPLIDGRGHVWSPFSTDISHLRDYTLGHQVYDTYDFTKAIQVGAKEFAPDCMIILGPGATLGGAVAQSLIGIGWQGWHSKEDFIHRQKDSPYLIAMGMEAQRKITA